MTAKLTISLSAELLEAMERTKTISINLETGAPTRRRAATQAKSAASGRKTSRKTGRKKGRKKGSSSEPRSGSLPARIIEWAEARGTPFGPTDVLKKFKVSRPHASMLMSRLASGSFPIVRTGRGVYEYGG